MNLRSRYLVLSPLAFLLCIVPTHAQVGISPLIPPALPLTITFNPSGFPSETVQASVSSIAEGPGNQSATSNGTATCNVHLYWPGPSLTGAPASVTLKWQTTDQVGFAYYLRGSGSQPSSGNVTGLASVTEQSGLSLLYSESYSQSAETITNENDPPAAQMETQIGFGLHVQNCPTNFQLDPEDGYYYQDIPVDSVSLKANDSYTAPSYGDTKNNGFTTASSVFFYIPQ